MKLFKIFFIFLCFLSVSKNYAKEEHAYWYKLKNGYFEKKVLAVRELGYARSKEAFWYYVKYLNYKPKEVEGELSGVNCRMYGAQALGMIRDNRAIPFLVKRYKTEKDDLVKERIIFAFRYYKNKDVNLLVNEALNSLNEDIKFQAILTAAEIKDLYFSNSLKELLAKEKDEIARCVLIYAINRTENKSNLYIGELKSYIVNEDPLLRYIAANYILRIKPIALITDLRKAVKIENKDWVKRELKQCLLALSVEKARIDRLNELKEYSFVTEESTPEVEKSNNAEAVNKNNSEFKNETETETENKK